MKLLKRILLALVVILVVSAIGGYIYFDRKFTPPDNYLTVSGSSENVPLTWVSSDGNPYTAVLLPVRIKGIDSPFYMQLDFGSPVTIFYSTSLQSITKEFSGQLLLNSSVNSIALDFTVAGMGISSDRFQLLDYGSKADFTDPMAKNIIGTIGTDLLERRVIALDFKNGICSFSETAVGNGYTDFEFKKRKILIPATIGDENLKLMYDSGTSGYELITNKESWEAYRIKNGPLRKEQGNSWGNSLSIISAKADEQIGFGNAQLKLSEVTYIEGTSKIQNLLMAFSGMQGMIGNKLFLQHKIILDCKNEKFKVE